MTTDPFSPHLKRAAQLFQSGDIVQAGQIWQAILKKSPAHEEARIGLYKVKLFFDARATQDGLEDISRFEQTQVDYVPSDAAKNVSDNYAPPQPSVAAAPPQPPPHAPVEAPTEVPTPTEASAPTAVSGGLSEDEADTLLKDGCTLYDMGMVHEAIEKWNTLQAKCPGHPQVQQYLDMGNRDLQAAARPVPSLPQAPAPPVAQALPQAPPQPSRVDVQAMEVEKPEFPKHEPIAPTPQLSQSQPGSPLPRRLTGELVVQKPLSPEFMPGDIQMEESLEAPVKPPAPLLEPKSPEQVRTGLKLPAFLTRLEGEIPALFKKPALIAGVLGFIIVSYAGVFFLRSHQKDKRLVEQVEAESHSAIAPLTQTLQIADLNEKTEDIRQQAVQLLEDAPLMSYYRCRELIRRNPLDAQAAQLMAQASAQLTKAPTQGSPADLDLALGRGNLEGADVILRSLLCQSPEDPILMAQLARICKDLSERLAAKEKWDEIESHLLMGRCLFPEDKSWSARLQLMTYLKSASPEARKTWSQLLG